MAKTTTIAGNTFLFTGKLTEFTREDAEAHIEAEGGKVLSGVSAKLNYLVVGEDAGSKLKKAEALGTVTILHEKEFLKMMSSGKKAPTKAATKKTVKATPKALKQFFSNLSENIIEAKKTATAISDIEDWLEEYDINNPSFIEGNEDKGPQPKKIAKSTAKVNSVSKQDSIKTAIDEIKIGKQTWCVKNLDVTNFRNGDPIPEAKTDKDWVKAGKKKQPAWCYYDNDSKNGKKYGTLYNWYAVNDSRGLSPIGYKVAEDSDWLILNKLLSKNVERDSFGETLGVQTGTKLRSKDGWSKKGSQIIGTDEYGFSAQAGGWRNESGLFSNILTSFGCWIDIDLESKYPARLDYIGYSSSLVIHNNLSSLHECLSSKSIGFSVRCLRD